jgi:hypothetical protein
MPMSLEEIFFEAKMLPKDSRAILAEKLVASIEDDIDPQVTKTHLAEVKKRRNEIRSGKVIPINGEEGLAQVRANITPHYWTASEALALQLDMLAYIDESGKEPVIVIGEGIKKEWLSNPMNIKGVRLHGNILDWQWDGKTLKANLSGNKLKVKAGSPFGENAKVLVVNNPK